jgi:hypothetical protein
MRAHTITTKCRPRRKARYSVLALALGVCALAIPATACGDSTQPDDGGAVAAGNAHRTPTELAQATAAGEPSGSGDSSRSVSDAAPVSSGGGLAEAYQERASQPGGGAVATDHSSPTVIKGGHGVIPGYASADAITGAEPFTGASGSPSGAEQWFDVPSALVGAGAAMALVSLGGAAFLTVRRRTEVSPSASTS